MDTRLEEIKKNSSSSQGKYLAEIENFRKMLEKNAGQVGLLEQEVQRVYLKYGMIEDENFDLKKRIEFCDCGKRKQEIQGAFRGFKKFFD